MIINPYSFAQPAGNELPPGLSIWARYKASDQVEADNVAIVSLLDSSGNARHGTQATSARRAIKRSGVTGLTGNTTVLEVEGTDTDPHFYTLPSMTSLTVGEIWVFLRSRVNPASFNRRIWEMGGAVDGYYTFTSAVYETFGRTSRYGPANLSGRDITLWHSYAVASQTDATLGTAVLYNNTAWWNAANTAAFSASPIIGGYVSGSSGLRLASKEYAEIIILSALADSTQRAGIQTYFGKEYLGL